MFGVFGHRETDHRTAHNSIFSSGRTATYDLAVADLPCPWCHAQTSDQDSACPSCGRSFGTAELKL